MRSVAWERAFGTLLAPCKGIRILESCKFLLLESGIQDYGIWNTAQGIRNPLTTGI